MKIIMYHYIHDKYSRIPYQYYLDITDFRKQLDYLENQYGFLPKEMFIEYIRQGFIPTDEHRVVLTFDDGLEDHYHFVFPELKKRNLWGIFFISTNILSDSEHLLDVHKLHIILSNKIGTEKLKLQLSKFLTNNLTNNLKTDKFPELYKYQQNPSDTLMVKKIINYYLPLSKKKIILNQTLSELGILETEMAQYYYLSAEEIKELYNNNMLVGSHTQSHNVLSNLSMKEQKQEIIMSYDLITSLLGTKDFIPFSFPYGREGTFNKNSLTILEQSKYSCAFMVKHSDIHGDIRNTYISLPRWDCNQFPFGKSKF